MEFVRKHSFWLAFGGLTLGSAAVLFFLVMPQLRANKDLRGQITNDEAVLKAFLDRKKDLPNKKIVRAHKEYKARLELTYREALDYFAGLDKGLEATLSRKANLAPAEFQAQYTDRMAVLKTSMRRMGADHLLPVEPWEKGENVQPDPATYEWMQKRLWILDDVCGILRTARVESVGTLNVKKPKVVAGTPAVSKKPLYRVIPVALKVRLPFQRTGNLINRFLMPQSNRRKLCTAIKAMHIAKIKASEGSASTKSVNVALTLEYLDFDIPSGS